MKGWALLLFVTEFLGEEEAGCGDAFYWEGLLNNTAFEGSAFLVGGGFSGRHHSTLVDEEVACTNKEQDKDENCN